MNWIYNSIDAVRGIVEAGGPVIYSIIVVAFLLWLLILERYWFLLLEHPKNLSYCLNRWKEQSSPEPETNWYSQKIRDELISTLALSLNNHISSIKTLVALCPLLGLLGTVMGMIEVFDVLAIIGTGNARAMADSISRATIPTMAGMVVALSGIYFSVDLTRRTKNESFRLKEDFQS